MARGGIEPPTQGFSVLELVEPDSLDFPNEIRNIHRRGRPDDLLIDRNVSVNQFVTHAYCFTPREFWVARFSLS